LAARGDERRWSGGRGAAGAADTLSGMTPIQSFEVAAASWQNFYLLSGTAAATLIGLMFVAVTFGSSLVGAQSTASARSFIDPPFYHFVYVLVAACLVAIPAMTAPVLGVVVLAISVLRTAALIRIHRHMREAHRKFGDIELSDWLSGIVIPLVCYLVLGASGAGFLAGYRAAFNGLALATLGALLLGIFGAWELMIWMALTRARQLSGKEQD
jgi:hypothetical protein